MVSFFKEKSAAAVLGIVIVSFASRFFFFTNPPRLVTAASDGLIYFVLKNFSVLPAVAIAFLYLGIIIVQALRINYALNDLRMFPRNAFTTALAYILLTALLPAWNNLTAAIVVNSMVIWLLFRILKLYSTSNPKTVLFNIGLITSCTVMLYYPLIPLLLIVFFTLAIYRPFRINEWLILLLGIITPFYFLVGILFLNDKLGILNQQVQIFKFVIIKPQNLLLTIITFSYASLIIIAGIYLWQSNANRMVIQIRKNWTILFFMLLLLIPGVFFINNAWPAALLAAAIPAAAFVSNTWLYPKNNFIPGLIFWLLAALIVYNNWIVTNF